MKDDRNRRGRRLRRQCRRRPAERDDHRDPPAHPIGRSQAADRSDPPPSDAQQRGILALDVPCRLQSLLNGSNVLPIGRARRSCKKADDGNRWLLRTGGERRGHRRAADKRDELAPFHCPNASVLGIERIAHSVDRRQCSAAGFRSSLGRLRVTSDRLIGRRIRFLPGADMSVRQAEISGAAGSRTEKTEPLPGLLVSVTSPPSCGRACG